MVDAHTLACSVPFKIKFSHLHGLNGFFFGNPYQFIDFDLNYFNSLLPSALIFIRSALGSARLNSSISIILNCRLSSSVNNIKTILLTTLGYWLPFLSKVSLISCPTVPSICSAFPLLIGVYWKTVYQSTPCDLTKFLYGVRRNVSSVIEDYTPCNG